jgi:hypothetical protein
MNAISLLILLAALPAPPEDGNHLVLSVTTDLQRTLLGRTGEPLRDAKAYVLINGEAVLSTDGMINTKALDLPALRQQLAPFADRGKGLVYFNVCYRPVLDRGEEVLLWALYGFAVHAGFRDARVGNSYIPSFVWDTHIAKVNEAVAGEPDGDEQPIGNEIVSVYPVRTALSRYLTSNADCIVDVLKPLDKDVLTSDLHEAIQQFVSKTELKRKKLIQLRIWTKGPESRQLANDFMSKRDPKAFAASLGFEDSTVSHTPR